MRKLLWIFALSGSLVLASCNREEVPVSAGMAISFSAAEDMDTKAAGMIADTTFLINGRSIGVFAYNTGHYKYNEVSTNPNFMYNEKVTYDGSSWTYSPIKYWPNGEGNVTGNTGERPEYLSFFAYAPYSNPDASTPTDADKCITAFHLQEEPGNPWLIYQLAEDPAHQVDVLFASSYPDLIDLVKPGINDKVNMLFHHALACVGEQLEIKCSVLMQEETDKLVDGVNVTKAQILLRRAYITYHLTARARLNLLSTGYIARWEPILNGEQTTDRIVTYGPADVYAPEVLYSTEPGENPSGGSWLSPDGMGILYIPYDRIADPQTFTVTVEYLVRTYNGTNYIDGPEQTRTSSTILLSSYPQAFAPSRRLSKLTINLTVDQTPNT